MYDKGNRNIDCFAPLAMTINQEAICLFHKRNLVRPGNCGHSEAIAISLAI